MTILEATDLVVRRGGREVVRVEHLTLVAGETLALLGPNGAGKSSLALALAGLLPTEGALQFHGRPIGPAYRRRVAMVFQRPLLLDRSVRDNVALGLALRGVPRVPRNLRADEELSRLGVTHLADRSALGLSGGEAQRVSLGRALALDPELLFLDEPFAALDAPTREGLLSDLGRALRGSGTTTILVTHDRDEALSLADRVAVLVGGRLRQVAPTEEVFTRPADAEVAAFVGIENVLPAQVQSATDELSVLRLGELTVEVTATPPPGDDSLLLCIRPDDIVIARDEARASSARNSIAARVVRLENADRRVRVTLDCGFPLVAHITRQSARDLGLREGDRVVASFKATVPHLLPRRRR